MSQTNAGAKGRSVGKTDGLRLTIDNRGIRTASETGRHME